MSYLEVKQLLSAHFGDTRDLSSLIQDLQRLKQLPNESPLTFFNRLQVLNAKIHSNIQKSTLTSPQKEAQVILIESMALNTLLTGLEPRLAQIIRASDPRDLLEAQVRIKREIQLSYFENQKFVKPQQPKLPTPQNQRKPNFQPRFQQRPATFQTNQSNTNFNQRPAFPNNTQPSQSYSQRPFYSNPFQQNRPNENQKPQSSGNNFQRPPFQRNTNPSQQRAHVVNYEQNIPDYDNYGYQYESDIDTPYAMVDYTQSDPQNFDNPIDEPDLGPSYQDFLQMSNQNHPPVQPDTTNAINQIAEQIKTFNLDDLNPNLNFPEQSFI